MLFVLLFVINHCANANTEASHSNTESTTIHHYDKGYSPLFRVYLTEVLKTVLDKSINEYGPYKIQFYSKHLSTNRSKLEAERGVLLDLLFASHWYGSYVDSENMIAVNFPIFDGLLGLRSLVITEQMNATFNQIESTQDFSQFIAGQGANWEDVKILKANEIPVIEAQNFDALFPMLAKNRFDYAALSSLEVDTALSTKGLNFKNLIINKEVGIFYPMPFYLFVNGKRPELAERVERGLKIALQDGTITRLFERHFGFIKPELQRHNKKLVVLNNPLLNEEDNTVYTQQFLNKYQQYFNVMRPLHERKSF